MHDDVPQLDFSQMMTQKPVEDQGIDSPWTMARFSDTDISEICEVIRRPGGLASGKIPNMRNQISVLVAKNLKPAMLQHDRMLLQALQHQACQQE